MGKRFKQILYADGKSKVGAVKVQTHEQVIEEIEQIHEHQKKILVEEIQQLQSVLDDISRAGSSTIYDLRQYAKSQRDDSIIRMESLQEERT